MGPIIRQDAGDYIIDLFNVYMRTVDVMWPHGWDRFVGSVIKALYGILP